MGWAEAEMVPSGGPEYPHAPMASRIEIELTSARDDATWTWRAAGAREPKGTLDGAILPSDAAVGTVYRADADFTIDGIDILSVTAPTRERKGLETLELLGSGTEEPLVTTTLARDDRSKRGGRGGKDRADRKGGRGKDGKGKGGRSGAGGRNDERGSGGRVRPNRDQPEVPPPPSRPKAPRLRAGRTHRKAALDALPSEQRPVAEQALKGGVPAVRTAVEQQNQQLKAEGKPEIAPDALVSLAESMLPRLRSAEWHDRAEAAVAQLDEVDLRDLRAVVTAADRGARDDETRALAATLRDGLNRRIDQELQYWIEDLADSVEHGRTVRGLRLSSRPPKAGSPVPPELSDGLIKMTNEALNADVSSDRWIRILDALAFSPIRARVVPISLPTKPSSELTKAIAQMGSRLPEIAHIFGIDPESPSQRRKRRAGEKKQRKDRPKATKKKPISPTPPVETAPVETAPVETAPVETAPVETAPVETAPVEPSDQ